MVCSPSFGRTGPLPETAANTTDTRSSPAISSMPGVAKLANGQYRLKEVSSRGWTDTKDGNAPGSSAGNLTAEVIAEQPYRQAYGEPLANFGTVDFSNISSTFDGSPSPTLYDVQYNNVKKAEASKSSSSALSVK